MPFSITERQAALESLHANPAELLVIGGGVVGSSVAAHAARLGLNVLLIEKEDFAAGASGNSTGLAHAGLRYLAQGRFAYVFHESRERRRLQQLAPQWVKPFNFLYPVYGGDAFPLWMVRLGTWIYDRMATLDCYLAGVPRPRPFEPVSVDELRARLPALAQTDLRGATAYFVDAQLPDHQFTLGFALDAVAHGARIVTHARPTSIQTHGDDHTVSFEDQLSGRESMVRPQLILNCAGAWIDEVRHLAGLTGDMLTRSRGTHVVIDRVADEPLIFSAPEKGRVFFVLPAGSDASVIGTTDVEETNAPDASAPLAQEVRDLLALVKRFFPDTVPVVRSLYWGVRPLYKQAGHVSNTSREHQLIYEKRNLWSLPGVKLTAARAAGEQAASAAFHYLRQKKVSHIELGVLPGADRQARLQRWLLEHPDEQAPVVPEETWQIGEAGFSAAEEMALTLNDFLWRRVKWPLFRAIPEASLWQIIRSMGRVLKWDREEEARQHEAFIQALKRHRWPSIT